MKSILKQISSLFLILCITLSLFACNLPFDNSSGTPNEPEKDEITQATALVTIDINPSIELTLDIDGTVASIYGSNEDGQILLYGETDNIVGTNYESAIDYITRLAKDLGYLNADTETIHTSVVSDDPADESELTDKISAKIAAAVKENGFTVNIDTTAPFSLLCELERFKEMHPDSESIQALTPTKYKLALTLSEREDVSVETVIEYDNSEIIKRINTAHGTLESYATDAYLAAKKQAVAIFDTSMGVLIDGVYNEIYLINVLAHPNTYYYGAIYQAHKTIARTYSAVYDIKVFADDMAGFELDDATVALIAEELGIEDTAALENESGKVTLESLIEFCNEFVASGAASDEVKAHIEEIIADAKVAAEIASKGNTDMYRADIESLRTKISAIITSVGNTYNTVKGLMSESARADIEACIADLHAAEEAVALILTDGITQSEVDALAAEAEKKAADMLVKIEADLSENEKALAETKINALDSMRDTLVEQFESRLSTAEAEARRYIEEKRSERQATK